MTATFRVWIAAGRGAIAAVWPLTSTPASTRRWTMDRQIARKELE
jgi:hypothetical protein